MSVSVITVVKEDSIGLIKTLESLKDLDVKPLEVVVKDFGCGQIESVCNNYVDFLNIKYINSIDAGIYDAMNQAKAVVCGDLIHYLNAGDVVYGEPYRYVSIDKYLPVRLSLEMRFVGYGRFGLGKRMYCHQGLFFPVDHPEYSTDYKISADLELILSVFPNGLSQLQRIDSGGVIFDKSGVSSTKKLRRDIEYLKIIYRKLGFYSAMTFVPKLTYTLLVGRFLP